MKLRTWEERKAASHSARHGLAFEHWQWVPVALEYTSRGAKMLFHWIAVSQIFVILALLNGQDMMTNCD